MSILFFILMVHSKIIQGFHSFPLTVLCMSRTTIDACVWYYYGDQTSVII